MSNAATQSQSTPNPNLIYLFALGATGIATGVQFAASSIAVYAAIVLVGGIAGMVITRAGLGKATLAFLLTSVVAALLYYFVISKMLTDAASTAVASETTVENRALAEAGAEAAGTAVGVLVAVWAFIQTFIPGFLGSAIGALVRPKRKGAQAARSSQPAVA